MKHGMLMILGSIGMVACAPKQGALHSSTVEAIYHDGVGRLSLETSEFALLCSKDDSEQVLCSSTKGPVDQRHTKELVAELGPKTWARAGSEKIIVHAKYVRGNWTAKITDDKGHNGFSLPVL